MKNSIVTMVFNSLTWVYYFRAKAGDIVLDICCGSGDLTFLLAEKVGVRGKVCWQNYSFIVPYLDCFVLC
jgi:predicted methyltransferase